jgi:hypothetical protein
LNRALIVNPIGRSCPPNAWRISRAADSIGNTFTA